MKIRHYLAAGLIAYLVILLATVPAAPVYQLIENRLPDIETRTVSGTLWRGSADTVETSQLSLQRVRWSLIRWRLLLAEAAYRIEADLEGRPVSADIGVGIGGTVYIHRLDTVLDAAIIAEHAALPMGEIAGDVNVEIESASWSSGSVPAMTGNIDWKQARVTVADTVQLGDVIFRLYSSGESPLSADISNSRGQLDISGTLNTKPGGEYSLRLQMKPAAGASSNLTSSLAMLAKRQPDGSFLLTNSGTLSQLGLM